MALAAAVTVATVVRLGLHAQHDRKSKSWSSSARRWPSFAVRSSPKGFLQGGIGALVALLLLWAGFAVVVSWWGTDIRAVLGGGTIEFLPLRLVAYLLAGGMLVGGAGGLAAARHAG